MNRQNKKTREKKKINILIVDDHQMVADGIRTMLESQADNYLFKISEATNGEDAISKVRKNEFDIVLMDYQLPKMTGAQTVYEMLIYKPGTKILALSNYDEHKYVTNIMEAGAKGYILKNIGPSELVLAIEKIMDGKSYFSGDIHHLLLNKNSNENPALGSKQMTRREREILPLIAEGLSNKEIALKLNIEKRTVDAHRQNLLKKLDVKNTASLVRKAIECKLI
jgi:DNA-binding NarL/FixJ family response regulator